MLIVNLTLLIFSFAISVSHSHSGPTQGELLHQTRVQDLSVLFFSTVLLLLCSIPL